MKGKLLKQKLRNNFKSLLDSIKDNKTLLSIFSIITLFIYSIIFIGCEPNVITEKEYREQLEKKKKEYNDNITKYFKEIEYKGHNYILLEYNIGCRSGCTAMVHDPDCKKCSKNK